MTYMYYTYQVYCWKDVEYLQEYDCLEKKKKKKKKKGKEWLNQLCDFVVSQSLMYSMALWSPK